MPLLNLPPELFKHVVSFLHPFNKFALRATNKTSASTVKRMTKKNAFRSVGIPNGPTNVDKNRHLMHSSNRHYMTHNQAKHYLQQMLEHKGRGNLFNRKPGDPATHIRYLLEIKTTPSIKQRQALGDAITSDNSEQGIQFVLDVIKHSLASNHRVHPRTSRTHLARAPVFLIQNSSEKGALIVHWNSIFWPRDSKPTDKQRKAIAQAITSDKSEQGREFMYDFIQSIIRYTRKDDSALYVLSPASMTSVSSQPGPERVEFHFLQSNERGRS